MQSKMYVGTYVRHIMFKEHKLQPLNTNKQVPSIPPVVRLFFVCFVSFSFD